MRIYKDDARVFSTLPTVIIEHKGKLLEWSDKAFRVKKRTTISEPGDDDDVGEINYDLFSQINGFWNYCSEQKQDKIFDIYCRMRIVFDNSENHEDLTMGLYPLVAELYEYHVLADIRRWQDFHSDVKLPFGVVLHDSFEDAQKESYNMTREQTYLKEDYKYLIALTIALRAMYPIWGEFILHTGAQSGNEFKEYYAGRLLVKSNIVHTEPFERLSMYVRSQINSDKSLNSAIHGNVSSEDFPVWMLNLVLLKRISTSDISGLTPGISLVANIFHFIRNKVKSYENGFNKKGGMIMNKGREGTGLSEENNLSGLENYKIKQDIPAGDLVIMTFFMENVEANAKRICPSLDPALLYQSIESVKELENQIITEAQITLVQWVLSSIVPARALPRLSKQTLLTGIAMTQALLWHCGHRDLAALVSARPQTTGAVMEMDDSARTRITKEYLEELTKLFPHARRTPGKNKERIEMGPNVAVESIELTQKAFSQMNWFLTLPDEWVNILNQGSRRYYVPRNIRNLLAALTVNIAKGTL